MAAAQFGDHFRVAEPFGDVQAFAQAPADFGTGDFAYLLVGADLVGRQVLGARLDVLHFAERHHGDAGFGFVALDEFLCVVGAVVALAGTGVSGAGVVAADDEVSAAVVGADQGVPQGFPGAGHAHGQVQKRQGGGLLGVALEDVLVAAHPSEMVDVVGLGAAHHRVDEQVGFDLARGAEG